MKAEAERGYAYVCRRDEMAVANPGMVEIRRDDLEHLLDWHNKSCGEAEDEGMFARLLAVLRPSHPVESAGATYD